MVLTLTECETSSQIELQVHKRKVYYSIPSSLQDEFPSELSLLWGSPESFPIMVFILQLLPAVNAPCCSMRGRWVSTISCKGLTCGRCCGILLFSIKRAERMFRIRALVQGNLSSATEYRFSTATLI